MNSREAGRIRPARLSLPTMLLYLLAAAGLIVLCEGAVIVASKLVIPPATVMDDDFPVQIWLVYAAMAVAALGAYRLQAKFVERRSQPELRLALRELLRGTAGAIGLVALVVLVLWLAGGYHIVAWRGPAALSKPSLMAIGAGLSEEILFRGFVLGLIERWAGSLVALVVSAMLFGLAHYGNAGAGLWPALALMLGAGAALGGAYLATGRLWLPIGLHFGWNFGQSALFGVNDSGTAFPSVVDASVAGPYWLTGGAFGPEASIPGFAVWALLALTLLIVAVRRDHLVPFRTPT